MSKEQEFSKMATKDIDLENDAFSANGRVADHVAFASESTVDDALKGSDSETEFESEYLAQGRVVGVVSPVDPQRSTVYDEQHRYRHQEPADGLEADHIQNDCLLNEQENERPTAGFAHPSSADVDDILLDGHEADGDEFNITASGGRAQRKSALRFQLEGQRRNSRRVTRLEGH